MADSSLFSTAVYAERLADAARLCGRHGLSGLVISAGGELAYLTGSWLSSHERLTALVIPAEGRPTMIAPAPDIGDLALSAVPELDIEVRGWVDGEDAHRLAIAALPPRGPVGLGESLTAQHVLRLQELLGDRATVLATTALKELFMRKDAAEIEELRAAAAAIDRVHAQVPDLLIPGRTEDEVAADLDRLIRTEHADVDFIIVGSGPNGANPHHSHSSRLLRESELVVIDIGGPLATGYRSDSTRTYVAGGGEPGPEEYRAWGVLAEAQRAAREAVRPGVRAADIDATARAAIADAGYGEYFTHRTGHGIGLSTHEEPFIMAGNSLMLEEGMTFSIEPGIYMPGQWGMRLEDIVLVTADGHESLNRAERTLR